ncbi:glycosyltransferase [Parapedobacter koreensis]|uniref:Glycosyltransferase involved in cell wall bisynthesis n=1 Tax=Parapedobacter koreensis TaxID=332977 RepID=A0A1H7NPL2_9SPHI|nr:glycosyltransferase [Parapedobacter koreensis]SEL25274.1 Glycosyltransferase involved in cell wall bisynthesis [Parapedobacter koreensis]
MAAVKINMLSITHYTALYGANRSLLNLIEGTKRSINWTVILRTDKKNHTSPISLVLEEIGVKYYCIPFAQDIRSIGQKGYKATFFYTLKEFTVNMWYTLVVARLCKKNKINYIHSNSSVFCFGAYVSAITRIKHIWHFREFIDKDYDLYYSLGFKYLKFWADKAWKIISISNAINDYCVIKRGITCPSVIVYNGVISSTAIPIEGLKSFNKNRWQFLIVGTISKAKNQLDAIDAINILINRGYSCNLTIAGDTKGEYYENLTKYIEQNNLEKVVRFIGFKNNLKDLYANADLTLVCSKNEGMGRVTIESMAFKVPVLAYDSGGTSELIQHLKTGYLYTGGAENLVHGILLLMKDSIRYQSISSTAQKLVVDKFTIERYAANFLMSL